MNKYTNRITSCNTVERGLKRKAVFNKAAKTESTYREIVKDKMTV